MPLSCDTSFNVPRGLYPEKYLGFEHYLMLKQQVCYDYRSLPEYRQLYAEGMRAIRQHPAHHLKRGILLSDAPVMIECCIRTLAICEVPYDTDGPDSIKGILERISGIATDSPLASMKAKKEPRIKNNSPRLQLHALAAFAYMNFYAHWLVPHVGSFHVMTENHVMYNAAYALNVCVQRGFVPPMALHVAGWLATTKARFGVDVRQLKRFAALRSLWRAHNDYLRHIQHQDDLWHAKAAKAPHVYRCANDGCDIRATHKGALKQCAGDCPPERKPHYCSRYCQRRHWTIHREFCAERSSSECSEVIDDDGDPDWNDVKDFHAPKVPDPHWDKRWPVWAEREGPEIFIDIPNVSQYRRGEVMRLRTRTLSPECLKAYKRLWTRKKIEATRRVVAAKLLPMCEPLFSDDEFDY
ncbi:hypothetical protein BV20DRAFT_1029529 [Pilatotrama ljubarskyi]|nr:hypothetical protein BV20DRAFT_1029529 [Pilatotrama ljubarskyi]